MGNCCFMCDWLTLGALVALCKCTGGAFDTNDANCFVVKIDTENKETSIIWLHFSSNSKEKQTVIIENDT